MKKMAIVAVSLAVWAQLAGGASAEGWPPVKLQEPAAAEAVLWEGVSALYQFAADPHHPFREELAGDYFDQVREFERQLAQLKTQGTAGAARNVAGVGTPWEEFKAAGQEVIQSGLEGLCCTSLQLSRLRERAEKVEAALDRMSPDVALAQ